MGLWEIYTPSIDHNICISKSSMKEGGLEVSQLFKARMRSLLFWPCRSEVELRGFSSGLLVLLMKQCNLRGREMYTLTLASWTRRLV